jgi:ribonuclease P protein component
VKKKYGFTSEDKLPSDAYQKLLNGVDNKTFISRAFVFVYQFNPTLPHAFLGLIVPKKKLKFAHDRNYAKRLNREYFRIHRQEEEIVPCEICVLVSRHAKSLGKAEWRKSLEGFWSHLKKESAVYTSARLS